MLRSDDFFGVFEWGAGGIVHIHLLRWMAGRGRYDYMVGSVPDQRRRRDACELAQEHQAEIAEWDLLRPEKFKRRDYDENVPPRRESEPLSTDADSDGSGSESLESGICEDPVQKPVQNSTTMNNGVDKHVVLEKRARAESQSSRRCPSLMSST